MTRPPLKYLSNLFSLFFLVLLAGCASGPPIYTSSTELNASFLSLQTTNPEVQADRFGVYAKAAGKSFIAIYDGEIMAVSYQWAIPGVALEKNTELPWRQKLVLQYNPESQKIEVFNLLESYTSHIRELSVLPDGTVEWPPTMLGIISGARKRLSKNGSLDHTDLSDKVLFTFGQVTPDEFQSKVAEVRAYRQAQARDKSRNRSELMGAIAAGLGQASQEIRAENQANQLRQAERQSEIMRLKDAEMRASSRRLAEQQRENEIKERQLAQQRATNNATGHITVIDNSAEEKKRREAMERLNRQVIADEEAARKARAQGEAETAALRAKIKAQADKNRPAPGATATRQ